LIFLFFMTKQIKFPSMNENGQIRVFSKPGKSWESSNFELL
jgi:hypothetical protein